MAFSTTSLGFSASAQLATAGPLGAQIIDGIDTVDLPGGAFVMGSAAVDAEEKNAPPHWVFLPPFSIGKMPITVEQYQKKMPADDMTLTYSRYRGKIPKEEIGRGLPRYPAIGVSWDQANEFCSKVGAIHPSSLPTEAQYEYAALGPAIELHEQMEKETGIFRAGDVVDFVAGRFGNFVAQVGGIIFTDPTDAVFQALLKMAIRIYGWRLHATPSGRLTPDEACYAEESPFPADFLPVSAFGLLGMAGGVWEWVADAYDPLAYFFLPNNNPVNRGEGGFKVNRGGSWETRSEKLLRAATRGRMLPHTRLHTIGFRLVAPAQPMGSRYFLPSPQVPGFPRT